MPYVDPNTVHNPAAGTVAPAAWGDAVRDALQSLAGPPRCRVYNSANQSIPNSTLTALTFNSERFDTDTMHSTSTNTSRITFTTAGTYLVGANVEFSANGTGDRHVIIRLNGGTNIAYHLGASAGATNGTIISLSTTYAFSAGDYIEVVLFQTASGAATLNSVAAGNVSPEAWAIWQSL